MPSPNVTVVLSADQQDAVAWAIATPNNPAQTIEAHVQQCLNERLQPMVTAMLSADATKVQSAFLMAPAQKRNAVKNTLGV